MVAARRCRGSGLVVVVVVVVVVVTVVVRGRCYIKLVRSPSLRTLLG